MRCKEKRNEIRNKIYSRLGVGNQAQILSGGRSAKGVGLGRAG
tara:strand:+ start:577 stop:705 length:129 start_codon:yes stop_codon:yes gene_type:complete